MDQMQMGMLQMLQAVTRQEPSERPQTKSADKSEFRDLMKEKTESGEQKTSKTETIQSSQEQPEETVDAATLQQLAAMQQFCADATQIVVVPQETAAVESMTGLPMNQQTVQMQNQAQPLVQNGIGQQEAPAQTATTEAQQPVVETAEQIEAPVAQAPKAESGELKQNLGGREAAETNKPQVKTQENVNVQAEAAPEKVFSHVETAPVKVSDTGLEAPEAKNVAKQLSQPITEALAKGETRVEVQLNPQNLGKITVELTQKGDGTLHIALHAENSLTRTMLEREMPLMQGMLNRDLQQQVEVHVPSQQQAQQDLYEGQRQHQQQQQQQEQRQQHSGEDFLNQLRLGLVPNEAVS